MINKGLINKGKTDNKTINKYINKVNEMVQTLPELEERKKMIEDLDNSYFEELGEHLPAGLLNTLGTWLLTEAYADKRTNKVKVEEYPILSQNQLLRRNRKMITIESEDTLEVINYHRQHNSSMTKKDTRNKKEGS